MTKNFQLIASLPFPTPNNVNVNMMPFIMGDPSSIPQEYRQYSKMIDCCLLPEQELGKVGYLTVSEGIVYAGNSQRRGGIHTEKHPGRAWGGGGWGGRIGGLYMASNVDNSCRIWDYNVETPGPGGSCDHLAHLLPPHEDLLAHELYWLHDGTPHQALEVENTTYRQFFRLVTSEVGVWYSNHSTANRLGVMPGCEIVHGNKFQTNG